MPWLVTLWRPSYVTFVLPAKFPGRFGSVWNPGFGSFSPALILVLRGLPTAFRHAISAWFDLLLLYSQQVIFRLHPVFFLFVLLCLLPSFFFCILSQMQIAGKSFICFLSGSVQICHFFIGRNSFSLVWRLSELQVFPPAGTYRQKSDTQFHHHQLM